MHTFGFSKKIFVDEFTDLILSERVRYCSVCLLSSRFGRALFSRASVDPFETLPPLI